MSDWPTLELIALVVLGGVVWLWFDILKARDIGISAARAACESDGLQLLDDTVSIASVRLTRNDDGRLALRRIYAFEYSDTGDNRRRGSVVLLGHRVIGLDLGFRVVPSGRTPH